MIEEKVKYY